MDSLPEAGEALTGFIVFNVAKEEFAVDIKIVHAILKTENYKKYFSAHTESDSIIEYKNENFHLLKLHKILKIHLPEDVANTRIILLNVENHKAAILADNIKEFLTVNKKTWEFLKIIPVSDKNYISGKIVYEGRSIYVPDLEKIFTDELIIHHLQT